MTNESGAVSECLKFAQSFQQACLKSLIIISQPHLGTLKLGVAFMSDLPLAFLQQTLLVVYPIAFSPSSLIIKNTFLLGPHVPY